MASQGDKRQAEDSDDEVIGPMPNLAAKPSVKKVKGLQQEYNKIRYNRLFKLYDVLVFLLFL